MKRSTAHRVLRYEYAEYTDDFVGGDRDFHVPDRYYETNDRLPYRVYSRVVYGLLKLLGRFHCRFVLHLKIENAEILRRSEDRKIFFYGNHTQPFGDVVIPALICGRRRINTLVSPANYTLPIIGKMLPAAGAIPVPSELRQVRMMTKMLSERCAAGHPIVIYPEAHVWPYCTFIRPFPAASFRYPVKEEGAAVYCFTTTYQRRRFGSKPRTTVFVDGPFYPSGEGSVREQSGELCDRVFACMKRRSEASDCAYIRYEKVNTR